MGVGAESGMGNHKGCPYDRLAWGYLRTNDKSFGELRAGLPRIGVRGRLFAGMIGYRVCV